MHLRITELDTAERRAGSGDMTTNMILCLVLGIVIRSPLARKLICTCHNTGPNTAERRADDRHAITNMIMCLILPILIPSPLARKLIYTCLNTVLDTVHLKEEVAVVT